LKKYKALHTSQAFNEIMYLEDAAEALAGVWAELLLHPEPYPYKTHTPRIYCKSCNSSIRCFMSNKGHNEIEALQ